MTGDDRFWQQILDDHRARPRELRRLDHELSGTEPAELSGAKIETLVHAGLTPPNRVRLIARRLASAGLLLVSLVGIAAVGLNLVYPSNVPTPLQITYEEAASKARSEEPHAESEDASRQRLHDLGVVDEQLVLTLRVLRDIRSRNDDPLRADVVRATTALAAQLIDLARSEATGDESVAALIVMRSTLANRDAPRDAREQALAQAIASLRGGIATMRDARFHFESHAASHREMWDRIRSLLPHPIN